MSMYISLLNLGMRNHNNKINLLLITALSVSLIGGCSSTNSSKLIATSNDSNSVTIHVKVILAKSATLMSNNYSESMILDDYYVNLYNNQESVVTRQVAKPQFELYESSITFKEHNGTVSFKLDGKQQISTYRNLKLLANFSSESSNTINIKLRSDLAYITDRDFIANMPLIVPSSSQIINSGGFVINKEQTVVYSISNIDYDAFKQQLDANNSLIIKKNTGNKLGNLVYEFTYEGVKNEK